MLQLQIALFAQTHPQPRMTCMGELLGTSLLVKSTFQVDLKWLVMRPTAPENFDGDATTDRLDPTWKVQVDSSRRSNSMSLCPLSVSLSPSVG